MVSKLPSQETLTKLLEYCPVTGRLFWKERNPSYFIRAECAKQWNGKNKGREAFTASDKNGYKKGEILGIKTSAHRVIWKMVTGTEPITIDHIDGETSNNRIENLRSVCHRENCKNTKRRRDNSSGFVGVSWVKRDRKWRAYIKDENRVISLGYFSLKEEAVEARIKAQKKHGYHDNHGER